MLHRNGQNTYEKLSSNTSLINNHFTKNLSEQLNFKLYSYLMSQIVPYQQNNIGHNYPSYKTIY